MIEIFPGDLLISRGRWFPNHVALAVLLFDEPFVYEYTMAPGRPACVRTNRTEPVGVQAHRLSEWLSAVEKPARVALRRRLYDEEVDRLVVAVDFPMGRLEAFGEMGDPNQPHLPANFVANALQQVGLFSAAHRKWSPRTLVNALTKSGIYEFPVSLD